MHYIKLIYIEIFKNLNNMKLCLSAQNEELLMALTVARLIWLRRNDMVFGRVFSAPHNLVAAARKMADEFSLVLQRTFGMARRNVCSMDRWSPPPCGFLKINWDATLDPVLQRTGIGIVIRDEAGGFFAAQAEVFSIFGGPIHD
jgi:hypothetical protein